MRPGPALDFAWWAWWACAVSVLWGTAPPLRVEGHAAQRGNETVAALERYARGDAKSVEWLLSRADDYESFRAQFTRGALNWIRSGDSDGTTGSRRVRAAAFALEAGFYPAVRLAPIERTSRLATTAWQLIIWAADVISAANQPAAEHLWFRAAIALAERDGDPRWLLGSDVLKTIAATRAGGLARKDLDAARQSGLVGRAQRRFPGDPQFLLAEVRAIERDTWPLGIGPRTGNLTSTPRDDQLNDGELAQLRVEAEAAAGQLNDRDNPPRLVLIMAGNLVRLDALARVESGYAKLAESEPVRAEALLRLAYHDLRFGRIDAALPRLEQVPAGTTDPFLRYFSHYFRAWALERSGRRELAEQPYRAAVMELPRGSGPARMRLAALLMLSGRRAEAAQLVNDILPQRTGRDETWELFKRGDARLIPELLRQLREAS